MEKVKEWFLGFIGLVFLFGLLFALKNLNNPRVRHTIRSINGKVQIETWVESLGSNFAYTTQTVCPQDSVAFVLDKEKTKAENYINWVENLKK